MSLRTNETRSEVPLLVPVSALVPAGTSRTFSFPDEFFGVCVSMILTNLDGGAVATYQINGESSTILTLGADAFRTFDDTKITLLTINASAGGATQLQAQVQLIQSKF